MKRRTLIHFVRHGEVENPQAIRYGRLPGFHLSETGRRQVERLLPYFARRPISQIYTSPLERTQQTATLLGIVLANAPIAIDDRLIEVKTRPAFEGKPRSLPYDIPDRARPDAEAKEQIIARMGRFIEEAVVNHHGGEIIAVVHGDPLLLLYRHLVYDRLDLEGDFYPRYGSILGFVLAGLDLKEVWYHEG